MRRRRRRRWLREDTIAPWATLAVVALLWWAGARLVVSPEPVDGATSAPGTAARTGMSAPAPLSGGPRAAVAAPQQPATVAPATRHDVTDLRERDWLVPVKGVDTDALRSSYDEKRGAHVHEAMDILAPRGTVVRAVEDGRIARLFTSQRGGLTVYQFDEDERFCYYYAHLDSYAPGLAEGVEVDRGDTIGYVGTTGNAPPNTPHLHFAIFKLGPDRRWWQGAPIDPYLVLR